MKEKSEKNKARKISFSAQDNTQEVNNQIVKPLINTPEADTLLTSGLVRMINREKLIIMIDYLPARLVRGKNRWYICYYQTNPSTGIRQRHRESFDIGRLPKRARLDVAKELIARINAKLPYGFPYNEDFYSRQVRMNTAQAFELVEKVGVDLRHATKLSYAYSMRKFLAFLKTINMEKESVEDITKKVAIAFSDHLVNSGLSGRSHNNDINEMKRVFNVLRSREIINSNPFEGIPKRRVEQKSRRGLSPKEVTIIMDHVEKVDKSVYLSCALLYFCFIRPNEQRFLRATDINLEASTINIDGNYSKNRKTAFVTIPDQLKEILLSLGIEKLKPHEYLLGAASQIGNPTAVSKSNISNRYRVIIQDLHAKRILSSIAGNTLYSWKDTGANALGRSGINGIALRDQMRHHSLEETQVYLGNPTIADEFIKTHHRLGTK